MYQPKMEKDIRCPLEYGLAIFGGKISNYLRVGSTSTAPVWRFAERNGEYYGCSAVIDVERTHDRWHDTPDFLR